MELSRHPLHHLNREVIDRSVLTGVSATPRIETNPERTVRRPSVGLPPIPRRMPTALPSIPESGRDQEFRLVFRIQLEFGPEPIHHDLGVAVDPGDEPLARLPQGSQAAVTVAPRHLLAHPVPEPLDRVEVRAVAG